jgi:hypothetical protein
MARLGSPVMNTKMCEWLIARCGTSTARLTLNSEFQGTLRRLKPEKHRTPLKPRPESELDFIESVGSRTTRLLYDTTVYIDILQNRFPQRGDAMLRSAEAWHSPVTEPFYLPQLESMAALC